jgi:hypothetical protein
VLKEGVTTGALVVKLTLERPSKGAQTFAQQLLGQVDAPQVRGCPPFDALDRSRLSAAAAAGGGAVASPPVLRRLVWGLGLRGAQGQPAVN